MDIARLWRDDVKIKVDDTTTVVVNAACKYCAGRKPRYRCPVCDPDGYLDDILREDQGAARRPVPRKLSEAVK